MATSLSILPPATLPMVAYDPEARMRRSLRGVLLASALLVFGIGGAAALVPMGGAVVAGGQIGAESRVKKIAHPTGGTVAEILVQNGQHVRKGQILVRLDDTVSGSTATLSALSVDQLLAQKARLEAEQLGLGSIDFPASLTRRTDASAQQAMANERRMFALRQQELSGLGAQLSARVAQYHDEIGGYRAQIAALRQQSALIEPERRNMQTLYDKKLVTLGRLNQLERTAVDLHGSAGALQAQIAQANSRISEARAQIIQIGQARRAEAGAQLAQVNEQLNQQQARTVSAIDERNRSVIRAPYDGVVEQLSLTTVGGVIRPAETIMEIVPDKDPLLVEAALNPTDVDQVHVDQPARVSFPSLSRTATPELRGTVAYVAAERVTDPEGRAFYPVRVQLTPDSLARLRRTGGFKSGVPAEVYIETGSRSMMAYITKPLRDQFARAFLDD
ncbi:HlyD family type I secretion periplasmic adaptor subunit [Sphingobium amiense]|uniref:Membrane fusion protein (MFP) family protein n=1 Tax=Sphingobium amiense TaxID=135719 RepID=A0A494WAN5_9SPHN|nr:HlyD family type I secretion periplasmic adaptor subunit [Sphingobium amiense]BBD99737.1 HlyD family type I secretion periplasmic adaptor subunit [Sphingobium amiense]